MTLFRSGLVLSLVATLQLGYTQGQRPPKGPATQIEVGANVHVSRARDRQMHAEVLLAADPTNANRLLGCSMIFSSGRNQWSTVVYASSDGGTSWSPTLLTDSFKFSGDPACTFDLDGSAYYVAIGVMDDEKSLIVTYRSDDGGRTWLSPVELPVVDREYVVVDGTAGKFGKRVYIHGTGQIKKTDGESLSAVTLFRSLDGGASFESAINLPSEGHVGPMGNSVVLSDGTLVLLFGDRDRGEHDWRLSALEPRPSQPSGSLKITTSEDGGETFTDATIVADLYPAVHGTSSAIPYLAIDGSNGVFKDRLYVVWPDRRSGQLAILCSHSSDKGNTWSEPVVVNDDRPPAEPGKGPDQFMPVVAVNREGVVGVMWYDRRGSPNNLDWMVRFSASLDGGETFLSSVKVSEGPFAHRAQQGWAPWALGSGGGNPDRFLRDSTLRLSLFLRDFQFNGGHTAGLAADANGIFHPFWIDNRTGVSQVWTTSVTVKGNGIPNGSRALADLKDVSEKLYIHYTNIDYESATGVVSVDAQLENTSREPIMGPVKLRILSVGSDIGVPEILGAENMVTAAGAVVDFADVLADGRLDPQEKSQVKRLEFKVSDLRQLRPTASAMVALVRIEVKAFGNPGVSRARDASTNAQ